MHRSTFFLVIFAEVGEGYEVQRSGFIVIKDFEQEACFILALWVVAIIGLKARVALAD